MARLSPPTTATLAAFTGDAEGDYTAFAATALSQATILFEIATTLEEYPDAGTVNYDAVLNGICDMADALYKRRPFRAVLSNPFTSESIGSYSYSKMSQMVSMGLPTGVGWFDLAVAQVGLIDEFQEESTTMFEDDDIYIIDGEREFVGPERHVSDAEPVRDPNWWVVD